MNKTTPEYFASIYLDLKQIAFKHGYALSIHGSVLRDFDLIAIPWITDASKPEYLIKKIIKSVNGFLLPHDVNPMIKPHGRLAWSIYLKGGAYIDISVMPLWRFKKIGKISKGTKD